MKKAFVILLSVSLLFVMTSSSCFAEKTDLSDISGHYAEKTINKWIDNGIISGYPDGMHWSTKTGHEFCIFLSRLYGKLIPPSASLDNASKIAGHLLPKATNS